MLLHIRLGSLIAKEPEVIIFPDPKKKKWSLKIAGFSETAEVHYTGRCCKIKHLLSCKSLNNTVAGEKNLFLCRNLIEEAVNKTSIKTSEGTELSEAVNV